MAIKCIGPRELYELQREGKAEEFIDVRGEREYRAVHAAGARSVPLGEMSADKVRDGRNEPVYLICQMGGRSRQACEKLIAAGVTNVVNVEGGTGAWQRAGLPVEGEACAAGTARGGMRRGARAVGMLAVIVALVLGVTVHPYFSFAGAALLAAMIMLGGGCCGGSCGVR